MMKWTNIKNIMLAFLVVINTLLLSYMGITTWKQNSIPDSVIKSSIKLLENEGFRCSEEIFPSSYRELPVLDVAFYSASDLSELFFERQLAFRTVDNTLVAKEGSATLSVSSNHFVYESGNSPVKDISYKKTKNALKDLGLDMSGAVYNEDDGYFYKMYKNANLFNMYIEAKLDKNGNLCYVEAQWPKELTPKENVKMSFIEKLMKIKDAFPAGGKVQNIELGYSLRSFGGSNYSFDPAWRVNVNDELKILK